MQDPPAEVHVDPDSNLDRSSLYRRLLAVSADPICAIDADRRLVAVDDRFTSLTGHDAGKLLGESASMLFTESGFRNLEMMLTKVTREGSVMNGDFELQVARGTTRNCVVRMAPLDDEGSVVCALRDVTGLQRREERLEVLDRVLRHNIRNKVGVVVGNLDKLLEETETPETVKRARIARENSEELLSLSDKARRYHRRLSSDPDRHRVEDLTDLVETVAEDARDSHSDAEIQVDVADHPPVTVDRSLLSGALEEVVGNAIEHHDHDTPLVEITVVSDGIRVGLLVVDDGPGIPDADQAAIQEGRERPLYHASGLGIWFVKWCLNLMDGQLAIEDNVPRGTTVTFWLPCAADPDDGVSTVDAEGE